MKSLLWQNIEGYSPESWIGLKRADFATFKGRETNEKA